MKPTVKVQICACTKCSMVGSMEIARDVAYLQSQLDDNDQLKYSIDIEYISRPELQAEGYKSPIVIIDGVIYDNADAATIMRAIAD